MSPTVELSILDATGDTALCWNHEKPEEVEEARQTILDLKARGYSFFLKDGTPSDDVTTANGTLDFRRVDAEILLAAGQNPVNAEEATPAPGQRGRRVASKPVEAVATRPLRGG